jgi:hypothetical protein
MGESHTGLNPVKLAVRFSPDDQHRSPRSPSITGGESVRPAVIAVRITAVIK